MLYMYIYFINDADTVMIRGGDPCGPLGSCMLFAFISFMFDKKKSLTLYSYKYYCMGTLYTHMFIKLFPRFFKYVIP